MNLSTEVYTRVLGVHPPCALLELGTVTWDFALLRLQQCCTVRVTYATVAASVPVSQMETLAAVSPGYVRTRVTPLYHAFPLASSRIVCLPSARRRLSNRPFSTLISFTWKTPCSSLRVGFERGEVIVMY